MTRALAADTVTAPPTPRYHRRVVAPLWIAFAIVAPASQPAPANPPPSAASPAEPPRANLPPLGAWAPPPAPPPPPRPFRRYGVHLGLNATATFDAAFGRYLYTGFSTQLTGVGALFNSERNYVVSALVFGGVALPLAHNDTLRLTADVTPAVGFVHSAPVNFLTVGLLAGVRLVHRSGFTAAAHLPLVGYAGSPQAQRGSVYWYYIAAIPTVPVVTLGYSF